MNVQNFHLGDILSVTTGRLVSLDQLGGVFNILNWMTGESLMTHQLIRASNQCGPALLAQHPDLKTVRVPDDFDDEHAVYAWLDEQTARFGVYLDVAPLPDGEWEHLDPIAEFVKLRGEKSV